MSGLLVPQAVGTVIQHPCKPIIGTPDYIWPTVRVPKISQVLVVKADDIVVPEEVEEQEEPREW